MNRVLITEFRPDIIILINDKGSYIINRLQFACNPCTHCKIGFRLKQDKRGVRNLRLPGRAVEKIRLSCRSYADPVFFYFVINRVVVDNQIVRNSGNTLINICHLKGFRRVMPGKKKRNRAQLELILRRCRNS